MEQHIKQGASPHAEKAGGNKKENRVLYARFCWPAGRNYEEVSESNCSNFLAPLPTQNPRMS